MIIVKYKYVMIKNIFLAEMFCINLILLEISHSLLSYKSPTTPKILLTIVRRFLWVKLPKYFDVKYSFIIWRYVLYKAN